LDCGMRVLGFLGAVQEALHLRRAGLAGGPEQGVYDGVAGDADAGIGDALAPQVVGPGADGGGGVGDEEENVHIHSSNAATIRSAARPSP